MAKTIESRLAGFDACFFCLGISSAAMKEADYERLTYGVTLAAAQTLNRINRYDIARVTRIFTR
jgi:hypothetical protein